MSREDEITAAIAERFPTRRAAIGIGDDAAVLSDGRVITTDLLVEGVDFEMTNSPRQIGSKALSVNLSDLAAMGATPDCFLFAIGCPESFLDQLPELVDGLAARAAAHDVELVGGDLSRAERVTICITAVGRLDGVSPMLRRGAGPGDVVWLSRPVGASAAGLDLLKQGVSSTGVIAAGGVEDDAIRRAILHHVDPDPEVSIGARLATSGLVTACIDVSDGVSTDLIRLCRASGVGAEIRADALPIDPAVTALSARLAASPLDYALNGGEEYALLFTSSASREQLTGIAGRELHAIGAITAAELVLRTGERTVTLESRGFDHFS